jgi:hypothetical protein
MRRTALGQAGCLQDTSQQIKAYNSRKSELRSKGISTAVAFAIGQVWCLGHCGTAAGTQTAAGLCSALEMHCGAVKL